jgi:hypothetical protein
MAEHGSCGRAILNVFVEENSGDVVLVTEEV